jgi:hypothetical protein
MTVLPRWFQISFLLLAGAGIAYVLIMFVALSSDIEDISTLEQSVIEVITLAPPIGRSVKVPKDAWSEIRTALKNSRRVFFTGWRGETWTYFCTLVVETDASDSAYLLELKTRPSLEGGIVLQLQRGTESSKWVYGSYTGNELLDQLQESFPNVCES